MADKVTRRGLLGRGLALVAGLVGVKMLPVEAKVSPDPQEPLLNQSLREWKPALTKECINPQNCPLTVKRSFKEWDSFYESPPLIEEICTNKDCSRMMAFERVRWRRWYEDWVNREVGLDYNAPLRPKEEWDGRVKVG